MWAKIRDKPKIKDKTGMKTNYITVLYRLHNQKKGDRHTKWLCLCNCGAFIELPTNNIVRSKGCKKCAFKNINVKHGKKGTRLYNIWQGMKQRCHNENVPNYKNYGARGIKICQEWLDDFMNFYDWAMNNNYQEGLTIDRIDNNNSYSPTNCRWADNITQQNNRRSNIYIVVNGEQMSLKAACQKYHKNYRHELRVYHSMPNDKYEFIC